ncbi:MAG TPA: hypothetical protein PL196_03235, partial [Burkholderiaceae bacterium]|nr:hypothetical protein [Burkholderiaceae bacterium]
NAQLPGDWNVVLTVSRDTELALDTTLMDWTRDFPVSVHWVDQGLWERWHWSGTSLQMHLYPHDSDVILFMDADTVVVGSLAELIESVAKEPVVAAWPAWQPPTDADMDAVLREFGFAEVEKTLTYSGYGLAFESPRHAPPYFNLGFVAAHRTIASDMALSITRDFDDVAARCRSLYHDQIAVCLNILRQGYRYRALDMRFNASNGAWDPGAPPPFASAESAAVVASINAMIDDIRVMHYLVESESFTRKRTMDGFDQVRAFCRRPGLDSGSIRLQQALTPLLDP